MNILISLNSPREFKNLLCTPFFEFISNDKSNKYIIISDFDITKEIYNSENISFIRYPKVSFYKKVLYKLFFERLYEYLSLKCETSYDQKMYFNRLKRFNKKNYYLGVLSYVIFIILGKKIFRYLGRKLFSNSFYQSIDVDIVLVSAYHSLKEKEIFNSLLNSKVYFFTDGWDAFTKQTYYERIPEKVFVWNENFKSLAQKNTNISKENIYNIGNPFFDNLEKSDLNSKVLFFVNNLLIYNEEEILKLISKKIPQNIEFSLRLPPGSGYYSKKEKYNLLFPNFKLEDIDIVFWNDKKISQTKCFDSSYLKNLNEYSIFVFTGPSTAMLDVLYSGKVVIMLDLKEITTSSVNWDWTESCNREVLNDIKEFSNFYHLKSIDEFIALLNNPSFSEVEKKDLSDNFSELLFKELVG